MSYNILEAGEGRIDPIAEVIRQADADVVLILEAGGGPEFRKLADRLNMDSFLAEKPGTADASVGILSRLPIVEAVNYAPIEPRLTRAALHAIIDLNGSPLPVIGVHLHARETLADEAIRLQELPALLQITAPFRDRPHLLMGDFNTSHPDQQIDLAKVRAKTRERVAAQNNHFPREVITSILAAGYIDTHALFHQPKDFHSSFTTSHPAMRVDFIFANAALTPLIKSSTVFAPKMARFASDHFPVIAEIMAAKSQA